MFRSQVGKGHNICPMNLLFFFGIYGTVAPWSVRDKSLENISSMTDGKGAKLYSWLTRKREAKARVRKRLARH
jgi:hypothetical protein